MLRVLETGNDFIELIVPYRYLRLAVKRPSFKEVLVQAPSEYRFERQFLRSLVAGIAGHDALVTRAARIDAARNLGALVYYLHFQLDVTRKALHDRQNFNCFLARNLPDDKYLAVSAHRFDSHACITVMCKIRVQYGVTYLVAEFVRVFWRHAFRCFIYAHVLAPHGSLC
jgi:hypothetical protein